MEQLVWRQSIEQDACLKGLPRPWRPAASRALPGSAEPVQTLPSSLFPRGSVVHSYLAQQWQLEGLPRPGLAGRSGRKGWGSRISGSLNGKAQGQVALGCFSLRGQGTYTHILAQNIALCSAKIVVALGEPCAALTILTRLWQSCPVASACSGT